jgi:hypothetical protein
MRTVLRITMGILLILHMILLRLSDWYENFGDLEPSKNNEIVYHIIKLRIFALLLGLGNFSEEPIEPVGF